MNFEIPDECSDWIEWIVADFGASEITSPTDDLLVRMFLPQDDERVWTVNLVREIVKALYPGARLTVGGRVKAAELGSIIGQRFAMFARMGEPGPLPGIDLEKLSAGLTPEQLKVSEKLAAEVERTIDGFYPSVVRALSLALCQPHREASEFVSAFAAGLARKPSNLTAGELGRTNTAIHLLLFMFREHVGSGRQLNSVSKVFDFLRPALPKLRVMRKRDKSDVEGRERRRIEKILRRLAIPFDQAPGRPPKHGGNSDKK